MTAGPDHGFDDDTVVAGLLRAHPPPEALRWVEGVLGGGTVVAAKSMRGGASASMHLLSVNDVQHGVREVVLRRYLRPEQQGEQPSCAQIEANALMHVWPASFATPELLGFDSTGADAGAPAVLMSRLDGRPRWEGKRRYWPGELVELAMAIHDLAVPEPGVVREFTVYRQASYAPPRWARDRAVWERAVEIASGRVPGPRRFIHRDFYPGNLLWRRGRLMGVVDWEAASVGPPAFDIAHCRLNFLYATPDLADYLLRAWEQATGETYEPWADIAAIVCVLDSLRDHPPGRAAREELDAALVRAVSDHG